jgi:tetratricopeptide (TPR) repeat protein
MHFKAFFPLALSLTPILLLVDTHIAQAECNSRPCPVYEPRGTYGGPWIPSPELLAELNTWIAQEQTKGVGDLLFVGYANTLREKFDQAEVLYSQALELATRNKDIEGQAAAHQGLGRVHTAIGKLKQASSELTTAREMYQTLGNRERLNEVQLQLREVNRQLQPSP